MDIKELREELSRAGISLKVTDGKLRAAPIEKLTPGLRSAVVFHKEALVDLLEPRRTPGMDGCPDHWRHVPVLPFKSAPTGDMDGKDARYRVQLFDAWFLLRFRPNRGPDSVDVTTEDREHFAFPDLRNFYLWAWARDFVDEMAHEYIPEAVG